ncbi:translation initiation factor IF-2-like [Nycticebus coucang]|uniref:translation initiation factor IF-2-like n=1 Tax=Nycticebus coucang TaxID=9470 RepID=UPI00234CDA9B|nr:translation initiation factor IF-2-like [Nycticebus coucang]
MTHSIEEEFPNRQLGGGPEQTEQEAAGEQKGCVRDLEARQALRGRRSSPTAAPAFAGLGRSARTRLSPTPHFPSVRARGPDRRWPAPAPTFGASALGHSATRYCFRPPASARRPGTPSLQALQPGPLPPTRLLYLLQERARGVERTTRRRGSATLSRRHCALPRGAGLASSCRRWGRRAASTPGGETLPLSVRPGKNSLAGASRERAGGRPSGEGSRGAGNGCHVAQVDGRPPPPPRPPAARHDLWFVLKLCQGAMARPAGRPGRPEPAGGPTSPAPPEERDLAWRTAASAPPPPRPDRKTVVSPPLPIRGVTGGARLFARFFGKASAVSR